MWLWLRLPESLITCTRPILVVTSEPARKFNHTMYQCDRWLWLPENSLTWARRILVVTAQPARMFNHSMYQCDWWLGLPESSITCARPILAVTAQPARKLQAFESLLETWLLKSSRCCHNYEFRVDSITILWRKKVRVVVVNSKFSVNYNARRLLKSIFNWNGNFVVTF